MSAIPTSSIAGQRGHGWQSDFMAMLPAIQTYAMIRFRPLAAERREDAVQEAIASACVSFQQLAAEGKLHVASPTSLAMYAVRRRHHGRHVGGSQDSARDAMSPLAQRRHRFSTGSYDVYDSDEEQWRQVAVQDKRASIPDLAAFRIDFAQWLREWSHRDRRFIAALARGGRTGEVAEAFGVTPGRVSQLRRRYERAWQAFQYQAGL